MGMSSMRSTFIRKNNNSFYQGDKSAKRKYSEFEVEFKAIAEILFSEYAIQTQESTYRITDVEFYWKSKSHPDESVYKRTYVFPNAGEWFFHYTGVDIALKNDEESYGGILIRGIYDIGGQKKYTGPMVCAMRLFSGTNAFENMIPTRIIKNITPFPAIEPLQSMRKNLGKNAITHDAHKRQYRFYINVSKSIF
jgi:hypothetical protein